MRALRARRRLVTAGLLAFAVGAIVAPALHNFDHHADHTHDPVDGREIAYPHRHTHRHPTADIAILGPVSGGPGRTAAALETSVDADEPPGPHGRGAAAHFGLAVTPTPTFVLAPAAGPAALVLVAPRPIAPQARDLLGSRTSRGPPAG